MSMNLCFITVTGNHHVEFPYQTSTKLTYAVLKETDKKKQLELIKKDLINSVNEDDSNDVALYNSRVRDVSNMLYDPTLKLTLI